MEEDDILICPNCGSTISPDNHYYIDWQDYELIAQYGQDAVLYVCNHCGGIVEPNSIPPWEYELQKREEVEEKHDAELLDKATCPDCGVPHGPGVDTGCNESPGKGRVASASVEECRQPEHEHGGK